MHISVRVPVSHKQRVGYHYTTEANWSQIKKMGLCPYDVEVPAVTFYPARKVSGIYMYSRMQNQVSHATMLVHQLQKGDPNVVLLECKYDEADLLTIDNCNLTVYHYLNIGKFVAHENEPVVISTRAIPASDIRVIGRYNVIDLLK